MRRGGGRGSEHVSLFREWITSRKGCGGKGERENHWRQRQQGWTIEPASETRKCPSLLCEWETDEELALTGILGQCDKKREGERKTNVNRSYELRSRGLLWKPLDIDLPKDSPIYRRLRMDRCLGKVVKKRFGSVWNKSKNFFFKASQLGARKSAIITFSRIWQGNIWFDQQNFVTTWK